MNATVSERVAAGAAFLDEHDPQWWRADVERAIDLKTLQLWQGNRCVLGQRCPLELARGDKYGNSLYAIYASALSGKTGDARTEWAQGLGFYLPEFDERGDSEDWDDLTAEWRRVIAERRAAP